jgi:hypothetical protein
MTQWRQCGVIIQTSSIVVQDLEMHHYPRERDDSTLPKTEAGSIYKNGLLEGNTQCKHFHFSENLHDRGNVIPCNIEEDQACNSLIQKGWRTTVNLQAELPTTRLLQYKLGCIMETCIWNHDRSSTLSQAERYCDVVLWYFIVRVNDVYHSRSCIKDEHFEFLMVPLFHKPDRTTASTSKMSTFCSQNRITHWRTEESDQRGGEWEPIKIPHRNLAYVPKSTSKPLSSNSAKTA